MALTICNKVKGFESMEKIKPLIDVPSQFPQMGFPLYAKALSELIVNADEPQFTIGIFGGYGSGKSTLLSAISKEIENKTQDNIPIVTVNFNAWRYDHEEKLILPFLTAIYRKISTDSTKMDVFITAIRAVLRNTSFEINAGFAKLKVNEGSKIENDSKKLLEEDALIKSYIENYQDIQEILHDVTCNKEGYLIKRLVVFIDDLDRCVPDKAFQLLESLKSCMDITGFIFVIAIDPRVLTTYLDKKYGQDFGINAEEYLQKIVQVPFHLPRIKPEDIVTEIKKLLQVSSDEVFSSFCKENKEYLPQNMRQIKRIYNTYLVLKSCKGINKEVLLTLLLLQVRWPYAYYVLHLTKMKFLDIMASLGEENTLDTRLKTVKSYSLDENLLKDKNLFKYCKTITRRFPGDIDYYLDFLGWPVDLEPKFSRTN